MKLRKDILDELLTISPLLANMEKINVFTVPPAYFNSLSSTLLDRLEFIDDPINITKVTGPFSVPEGYFNCLATNILNAVKDTEFNTEEKLIELPAHFAGLHKINVFKVPSGYFETLPAILLKKATAFPAKVVSINRPAIFRYAAAAVITGIMGLSVFSIFNNRNQQLTSLYSAQVMAEARNIVNTNSFDKALGAISTADIENYLKQSGQNVHAALVADATEETNLPSQEEYLYNENTLDEFLKSVNLNN